MDSVSSNPQRAGTAPSRRVELLAPAGDWECARAAVENGADAVYFGLEHFNARMRARNFTSEDLPKLLDYLHRRGVNGYVTFNTLVFADELDEARRALETIIAAGADAAIVQDIGICRLIRRMSPDFPVFASTQMSVSSAAGCAVARELGCRVVTLARECSLREIGRLRDTLAERGMEDTGLEVFVHGALCVSYSGQCLASHAAGGRSANRGECAQPCRLPYELICDGRPLPADGRRYPLSPQDLAGLESLPGLIRAGATHLKIEGRLKTPEYVAVTTWIYRRALDKALGRGDDPAEPLSPHGARYELEMAFSRGLSGGWLPGTDHRRLVHGRFSKSRGVFLGEVRRVAAGGVVLCPEGPLKPGDGVVFDAGRPDQPEQGGRVYEIRPVPSASGGKTRVKGGSGEVLLTFGREDVALSRIHPGDKVWKTGDPELERRVRRTFEGGEPCYQRPVDAEVSGREGGPLTVVFRDDDGHEVEQVSALPLSRAEKTPLDAGRLRGQLGRLGGTPFRLRNLVCRVEDGLILPVSELNRLRREAAAALESRLARPRRWTLRPTGPEMLRETFAAPSVPARSGVELAVLVRNMEQLETVLSEEIQTVYCDFEDLESYPPAVRRFRDASSGGPLERTIWIAPPRMSKPGEEAMLEKIRGCGADGWLARNYDHLERFAGSRCAGDFTFNVANPLTAGFLLSRFRLERLAPACDLPPAGLEALLRTAPPECFEIILHHHVPMFHMEHCVFCAALSEGAGPHDCGRPCGRHRLLLKDRQGEMLPVKADAACRNTVFGARPRSRLEEARRWLELGVRRFRIELLDETPSQAAQLLARCRRALE